MNRGFTGMIIRFLAPATLTIRNGNVVTSDRWRSIFESLGHRVVSGPETAGETSDLLVVFNAYKNREAIRDAVMTGASTRIVICLTGTDLYQDLKNDPTAEDVLYRADQLVVLHPLASDELPPAVRGRTMVIYQSAAPPRISPIKETESFDVCVISHLRQVKDPLRAARAARLLPPESEIRVFLVGKALSDELAEEAAREVAGNPRFHWLGEQSGQRTAEIIQKSRLLVLSSLFEGGANVVSEAVVSDVPVIGTDIACMKGLLGADYPGLFPVGDTRQLAELLLRAETDQMFCDELAERCRREAYKFDPALERENLRILLERLFQK
jgi:putative glycosyltransferase (TIGR04348 family)